MKTSERVRPDPNCPVCDGRGFYCAGYSGRDDDGNAPIIDRCDCEAVFAPPSIALGLMAWRLAWERKYRCEPYHFEPAGRCQELEQAPATEEYYRIIDRISAGEAP